MNENEKGFGVIGLIIVLAVVGLAVVLGWLFFDKQRQIIEEKATNSQDSKQSTEISNDSDSGYLVIKEWNLRFKVPDGLAEVQYRIHPDGGYIVFYGKPTGANVKYEDGYDKVRDNDFWYTLGRLQRFENEQKNYDNNRGLSGKKIGTYYYYSFGPQSTTGLFGQDDESIAAEVKAAYLISGEWKSDGSYVPGMLDSIESSEK